MNKTPWMIAGVVIVVLAAGAAVAYVHYRNAEPSAGYDYIYHNEGTQPAPEQPQAPAGAQTSTPPQAQPQARPAGPQKFSFHGYNFTYPAGWTAKVDTFVTSRGVAGETNAFFVYKQGVDINQPGEKDFIVGSNVSCSVKQANPGMGLTRCKDVLWPGSFSISTASSNSETLAVFDQVVATWKLSL